MPDLVCAYEAQTFAASQEGELLSKLEQLDQATTLHTISSLDDVKLSGEAVTLRDGFRYSPFALQTACSFLGLGLGPLLFNVAGLRRRTKDDDKFCSVGGAIDLFNTLLDLRFGQPEGLSSQVLVVDEQAKQIVGIVGQRYQYLPNVLFFDLVRALVEGTDDRMAFAGAKLVGRQVYLTFLDPQPRFTLQMLGYPDEPFCSGVYFSNTESGQRAVRGYPLFQRYRSGEACLSRNKVRVRMPHTGGKKFQKNLQRFLGRILEETTKHAEVEARARKACTRSLALPAGDLQDAQPRLRQLTKLLTAEGAPEHYSQKAVRWAAKFGRETPETGWVQQSRLEARMQFDLFAALIRQSKHANLDVSESIQHVAYDLLVGNILV